MTREEIEKRVKNWQFYGEEPDLITAKLVNDMKYAYLRLHLDHQKTLQDLRELCEEILGNLEATYQVGAEAKAIKKKYGWEEES